MEILYECNNNYGGRVIKEYSHLQSIPPDHCDTKELSLPRRQIIQYINYMCSVLFFSKYISMPIFLSSVDMQMSAELITLKLLLFDYKIFRLSPYCGNRKIDTSRRTSLSHSLLLARSLTN